ncbi:GNAT family N-acetyltransferase [Priestia megaterium]|uniref:GNAT family N-acetyltransferase n=1 Tax=Priestia megaterium TaxID=1404 RepID=UPI002E219233|nr:GNAT family N-acetyltransferase [Priestia megaterium]MED4280120.1 GNAT family N-acetyltransferase [Priestia megaterium]MED4319304.1 GNAT family N-acetyltransferase [Priestia megaterium]
MIKRLDNKNREIATEILSTQIPSYLVEATIIDYYDLPPLKDTIDSLQQCQETFFAYYLQEELCGIISFKLDRTEVDLHRLIVHPEHFRKGIAQKLLDFVETIEGVKSMRATTGAKNTPAINFYLKNGFRKLQEVKVDEHLTLSSFRKYII